MYVTFSPEIIYLLSFLLLLWKGFMICECQSDFTVSNWCLCFIEICDNLFTLMTVFNFEQTSMDYFIITKHLYFLLYS